MKPKIHYIVRHFRPIITDNQIIDYELFEKKFENENPILARKEAFNFYEGYQEAVEKGNLYHQIVDNKELEDTWWIDYMENNPNARVHIPNFKNPVVLLVKDVSIIEDDYEKEVKIHSTINTSDYYDISDLMLYLEDEYSTYKKLNYDIQGQVVEIPFWDPEPLYDGGIEEESFNWHSILQTPFNWSPYTKENWWEDPAFRKIYTERHIEQRELKKLQDHEKLIAGGESETVEFKPLLFSTISGSDKNGSPKNRDMRYEVAQIICSFLNKNGGNIYIGVNDKGLVIGINMEGKVSEDEYIRHFSQLKNPFFSAYSDILHHYISGKFETIQDKRVFVIMVRESKHKPVFLFHYDNKSEGKTPNEFYVREGTSSKKLYDPKQMVDYVEEKWWKNKNKD